MAPVQFLHKVEHILWKFLSIMIFRFLTILTHLNDFMPMLPKVNQI